MALQVKNYETREGIILNDAYLRVFNVTVSNNDYEFFANSDEPDVFQKLEWVTRVEGHMNVYVWSDEGARKNRAVAVYCFTVEFNYYFKSTDNIYTQAYKWLNDKKFDGSALDV